MKVAIAQINPHIGNFVFNTTLIKENISIALNQKADIIVFPELAICGYPPLDLLEYNEFIEKCENAIIDIAKLSHNIGIIIGAPVKNTSNNGKSLYNAAYFLADGKIKNIVYKTLLPNYDIFDEYRYFEPNTEFNIISFKNKKIALTICEDLWNNPNQPMYGINPMDELIKQKPDYIFNIAASPFHYQQAQTRKKILSNNCKKYHLPLIYVNQVGAQTELVFDGGSMALNQHGDIIAELNYFEEDLQIINLQESNPTTAFTPKTASSKISLIHDALVLGIKDYFKKMGFNKAILGLSGGIDSAVTIVLAAKALGAENVYGILLPSEYSSNHSIKDAEDLAKNLSCPYDIIPIHQTYQACLNSLKPIFKDLPFGLTEENIQARNRGVLLMAISNKLGYILLNTSNKSEAAVGYGTLYGDMCGGLSVLGDVYKTDVFELARYINKDKEIIPYNSIVKPPSAELRPNQKDSDSLPDYNILDAILFEYIENKKGPEEIEKMGFEKATVSRIIRLVNNNEYKRFQTPPIIRTSQKAFGLGRRIPLVAKHLI